MSAVPRRMLLFTGLLFVLLTGARWALTHASRAKAPAKAERPAIKHRVVHSARMAMAHSARTARAHSAAAPPVTPRPPASVPLSGGWRWLPDPHNLGVAED